MPYASFGQRLMALVIDVAVLAAAVVAIVHGVNTAFGTTFNAPWRAETPVRTQIEVASRQTVRDPDGTLRDTTVMRETREFADGTIRIYAVAAATFTAPNGSVSSSRVENMIGRTGRDILRGLWTWLLCALVPYAYFTAMEGAATQATIGKLVVGLKVTDLGGRRLGYGKSAFRQLMKFAELLSSGVTYLIAAFTARHQALHDMFAGTLVLRARAATSTLMPARIAP